MIDSEPALLPNRRNKSHIFYGIQICIIARSLSYFLLFGSVATIWDMNSTGDGSKSLAILESLQSWRWTNGNIDRSTAGATWLYRCKFKSANCLELRFAKFQQLENNSFAISIYNSEIHPIKIHISMRDSEHDKNRKGFGDRYDESFTIYSGWNDITIPLKKISNSPKERILYLNKISSIVIFCTRDEKTRHFNIDNVRLIK